MATLASSALPPSTSRLGGLLAGLLLLLGSAAPAGAQTILSAANSDDLVEHIQTINGDPTGNYEIQVTDSFRLDEFLEPISMTTGSVRIVGWDEMAGQVTRRTISGRAPGADNNGAIAVFFVDSGVVGFESLTIDEGWAQGGDGGDGRGGGGLGAAGALFVNATGVVTLTNVAFTDNTARGGDGGAEGTPNLGGGGGGFHGDGGDYGGGGGGFAGDGGGGFLDPNDPDENRVGGGGGGLFGDGRDVVPDVNEGDGGGKTNLDPSAGGAGNPDGGGDGELYGGGGFGRGGGDGGEFGGGGGGGTSGGGRGGDFGGGGGGVNPSTFGDDGTPTTGGAGGRGGFGGGGGGGSEGRMPGEGGFGGGDGTIMGMGEAGDSLGGAVFVRSGGQLTIVLDGSVDAANGGLQDLDGDGVKDVTNGNRAVRARRGSGDPLVQGDDLYLMTGTLNLLVTATAAIDGEIAGDGGLLKAGTGTLVLDGDNSYTGMTRVAQGTLQVRAGSLPGDVEVQPFGTLVFDQGSSGTYADVISGDGNLGKIGTGTLRLTGQSTFTGRTSVLEGTLSVTTQSLADTQVILVNPGAAFRLDQDTNGSFTTPVRGSGTFQKRGSGRVTLDADYLRWNGGVDIGAGEIVIGDGFTLNSTGTTVASGARLSGLGTLSATGASVDVSGTVSPGTASQALGTLTIGAGDLALGGGSVLEVDVTDAGGSPCSAGPDADCLNVVSGSASLGTSADDATRVVVRPDLAQLLPDGDQLFFTIVSTTGGVSGVDFATVQDDFCFLDTALAVNGNDAQLVLTGNLDVDGSCSGTRNQRAVGRALIASVDSGEPGLDPVLDSLAGLTEDGVAAALDDMSGEGLGSFGNARLAAATQFLGSLSKRMRHPSPGEAQAGNVPYPLSMGGPLQPGLGLNAALAGPLNASAITASMKLPGVAALRRQASPFTFVSQRGESGIGGWLDGFATFASVDGKGGGSTGGGDVPDSDLPRGSNDTDFNLYGTSGGVDWAFTDGGLIGAAFGYTRSKTSVSDLATWGTGDTLQGALYGAWANDLLYVGAAARYAYTQMDTRRRIAFGTLYETARGDFDGSSISGYLEAGLAALEWGGWFFQPSSSFQYTYIDTESFTEHGAPGLNLNVASESWSSEVLNLGLRAYAGFDMDESYEIVPEFRVRWGHEFGDTDRPVNAWFDDSTVAAFQVDGAEIGRDVAVLGVGWSVIGEGNMSLSLDYDVTLNEELVGHTLGLGLLIYW